MAKEARTMGREGAVGREGASGDAGTDLIDEADGIHAILRDEVTAAAAEPSEHRGPPTLHAQWWDLSDLIRADSHFFIKNNLTDNQIILAAALY
tara:strand:+ start:1576 stop:1857 length:282 start_codon:yes stop_codon:yes gene_type:complete